MEMNGWFCESRSTQRLSFAVFFCVCYRRRHRRCYHHCCYSRLWIACSLRKLMKYFSENDALRHKSNISRVSYRHRGTHTPLISTHESKHSYSNTHTQRQRQRQIRNYPQSIKVAYEASFNLFISDDLCMCERLFYLSLLFSVPEFMPNEISKKEEVLNSDDDLMSAGMLFFFLFQTKIQSLFSRNVIYSMN